jgi:ubiquinone/menaquinone biosynthesis C-methylase UbiE
VYRRFLAAVYDRALRRAEAAGLRQLRSDLLSEAIGRTLEVGAGTGLNLHHYPNAASELVFVEPSTYMVGALRRRITDGRFDARIVAAAGEKLPFDCGSFDTVVVTMALCTVSDPEAVVREIARVLEPGGHLLFLEHVRSSDRRLAWWQDRLTGPWRWMADGCRCNRDTRATIDASSLSIESIRDVELEHLGPLIRPAILGAARRR